MSDRTLKMTSPAMEGADVKGFQSDLNAELGRWLIGFRLTEDGVYGPQTRDVAKSVCYGLGLSSPVMEHGATPSIRIKVRHRRLAKAEAKRFDDRAQWRKKLRLRLDGEHDVVGDVLAYARSKVGVKESPPNSNRGPLIDKWQRACGFIAGPWCGAFTNACLTAAGFPDQEWLRYCPWIEGRAKSGEGGWRWTQTPEPGDLVLYGARIAQHVGVVSKVNGQVIGDTETIEGNTGSGPGGSQANGGMVAIRHRHKDGSLGNFPIRGYARPPYGRI